MANPTNDTAAASKLKPRTPSHADGTKNEKVRPDQKDVVSGSDAGADDEALDVGSIVPPISTAAAL
jgi:hypothetical protein